MYHPKIDFDQLKQNINLASFASLQGYEIDRKKSTRTSIAMKSPSDKIIITRKGGKWVYFSVNDERDKGTIIDFVSNRSNKSIAEIGRHLAQWSGLELSTPAHTVEEPTADTSRVNAVFQKCKLATSHAYLESRGLGSKLLSSKRFKGRIYSDRYANAVFPHYRKGKVCGLELKNAERGLLVKGSQKSFWRSNTLREDSTVVVTETVIDALSYQQYFQPADCFYMATGGGVSPFQLNLFIQFLESSTRIKKVIVGTDHDEGGDRIAAKLIRAVEQARFDGEVVRQSPEIPGADWNDMLNRGN